MLAQECQTFPERRVISFRLSFFWQFSSIREWNLHQQRERIFHRVINVRFTLVCLIFSFSLPSIVAANELLASSSGNLFQVSDTRQTIVHALICIRSKQTRTVIWWLTSFFMPSLEFYRNVREKERERERVCLCFVDFILSRESKRIRWRRGKRNSHYRGHDTIVETVTGSQTSFPINATCYLPTWPLDVPWIRKQPRRRQSNNSISLPWFRFHHPLSVSLTPCHVSFGRERNLDLFLIDSGINYRWQS